METRDRVLDLVRKILIGPNPLPGYTQANGEEILYFDSPLKTYVSGVLFPQMKTKDENEEDPNIEVAEGEDVSDTYIPDASPKKFRLTGSRNETEAAIEAETSRINDYKQSAMGITVCIPHDSKTLTVDISSGAYVEGEARQPREKKNEDGTYSVVLSDKLSKCWSRKQVDGLVVIPESKLPTKEQRHKPFDVIGADGKAIEGMKLTVTYRLERKDVGYTIYTFTLLNTRVGTTTFPDPCDCWFQVRFGVTCDCPLAPLPDNFWAGSDDFDYKLNALLYRDVKSYAIGHGCAATWDDDKGVPVKAEATVMPEYDVKPISPGKSKAKLSMKLYFSDRAGTIKDLTTLCTEYRTWIDEEEKKIPALEEKHRGTAETQITLCRQCLTRIEGGITLLQTDDVVWEAFRLANRAMLMQQLHYRLPMVEVEEYDTTNFEFKFKKEIKMPDVDREETWDKSGFKYGFWRPFQIAFILLNLNSMNDETSAERELVDLIWFPTGGGKTEAYLGLTAYTIFLRRLKDKTDAGTTVIMRYTLRLLTAQQYERASSLICAMEKLRAENEDLLGTNRISIGLWVGKSLTSNTSEEVIKKIENIKAGEERANPSVILKCPWCGASMETFDGKKTGRYTPGYVKYGKRIRLQCANSSCDFASEEFPLPLHLFDDDIYENPPTLLFGTVDKFAMLPFLPEAKKLFGGDGENLPPELIIQDELHLITGPLGSAVGLYETLIHELCRSNGHKPKIVASTATISHAKQQCNALYDCGEENVFQFPVQGISYSNCFFAKEDREAQGRKYIGLFGSAASSSATASIYTFAAFLYAAKAIDVSDEAERDPYWTNLSYFGSMRELGQAATWYIADIKERLEVMYQHRLQSAKRDERRYLFESGLAELTSRMSNEDIPKILKKLEAKYTSSEKALDMCLATNMVSVGVDVPRLGLMTVTGQPKSFSEYIQATSRVGRSSAPGIVFIIYNTSKSRDKSHYEKFQIQHSKLYFGVEPTSVTPFSRPLRERAVHAIFVALHRFAVDKSERENARRLPTQEEFERICNIILARAERIDPDEVEDLKKQLKTLLDEWDSWRPEKYDSFRLEEDAPLLYPMGTIEPMTWGGRGWRTPLSMRNVDSECGLDCSKGLVITEDE